MCVCVNVVYGCVKQYDGVCVEMYAKVCAHESIPMHEGV